MENAFISKLFSLNAQQKFQIVGSHRPAIMRHKDGLYAISGSKWIKLPEWVKSIDQLDWHPDFDTFEASLEPFNFEEYELHKTMLATNDKYKRNWQLYVQQQYLTKHGIDTVPKQYKNLHQINLQSLVALRHKSSNVQKQQIVEYVTSSKGDTQYKLVYDPNTAMCTCTCKGFEFRHTCKHVTQFMNNLYANK